MIDSGKPSTSSPDADAEGGSGGDTKGVGFGIGGSPAPAVSSGDGGWTSLPVVGVAPGSGPGVATVEDPLEAWGDEPAEDPGEDPGDDPGDELDEALEVPGAPLMVKSHIAMTMPSATRPPTTQRVYLIGRVSPRDRSALAGDGRVASTSAVAPSGT